MKKLKYVDHRPIRVNLRAYRGFCSLPNEKMGNVISVTDTEARVLLKRKNGSKPCFELIPDAPRERTSRRSTEEQ